jgi:predicted RNA-binding protein YlxR (DUF448 family)
MTTPTRTCIGCRTACPASELVRLCAPEDRVQRAAASRGRGAWLHPRAACLEAAVRGRAFSRAFRRSVTAPALDDLLRTFA